MTGLQIIKVIVEVVFITVVINYLLSFFWNSRSMDLIIGVIAFLAIFLISSWLDLPVLHKLMLLVANVAVIAIIVIFQPELRVALSKLSWKGRRIKQVTEFDKFLDQLTTSIYRLADMRIGALIVLQNEDSLDDFVSKGIRLNADFSSELIESLFAQSTPLHDGACVIANRMVVAAGVILPLCDPFTSQVSVTMGTRHRAALGMSQNNDSIVIVVSEETGNVSICRDSIMSRKIKPDRLKKMISNVFAPDEAPIKSDTKFNLVEWFFR
ncbi:MAG: Cyclic di-AMP synthase CdaA [Chlamydiia bacterium]|nr:Cyclic di-AMP synthase CdaA [Chlamydiia bacterium]